MKKQITIIYDEFDLITHENSIMKPIRNIAILLGVDKTANGNVLSSPHAETKTVIGFITFDDVELIFVHESIWDYDHDKAESEYGVSENRLNTVFDSNLDVCVGRIKNLLN